MDRTRLKLKGLEDNLDECMDLINLNGSTQPLEDRHIHECFEKLTNIRHEIHEWMKNGLEE